MKLVVRPRLQVETWSLYWKEPMSTDTQCLPDVEISAEPQEPLQQVLRAAPHLARPGSLLFGQAAVMRRMPAHSVSPARAAVLLTAGLFPPPPPAARR